MIFLLKLCCHPVSNITVYLDRAPHLEHLLVQQAGSKHCDAIGVNHCLVAPGQRAGHLLLAVQQQCHILLGNRESNAMPPTDDKEEPQAIQ